jgi:hypothetical protein
MTNAYYTTPADVVAGAKVRSIDLNTIDSAIDTAFDKLPTETNIKQGKVNYAVDTGVADAYLVALPHAPVSYSDGLHVRFKPANTNTGASTMNVSSLGVKSIKKINGDALSSGDLTANGTVDIYYNSTTGFFYLSSAASAGASATAAEVSAAAAASSASSASASASDASTSASSASTSASSSSTSASTATTQASNASTSATNAATSASSASTSATNAATSETNAASSATSAAASAAAAISSAAYIDTNPVVKGSVDDTKRLRFEVDGFTTATTRVLTPPNYDGTIATIAGSETLTNKTLTTPTLTTPSLGEAVATSINKVAITTPATSATLSIADGATLATSGANSITLTSTGATNVTLPTSGTLATTSDIATAGALALLSTVTASASSTVDVESTFSSTYDAYLLVASGIKTSADGAVLQSTMKIGGAYDTGNNYKYHCATLKSDASTYVGDASGASGSINIMNSGIGNAANEGASFSMMIFNPSSTTLSKRVTWHGSGITAAGLEVCYTGSAHNTGTASLTGIRFFPSSGNIASGSFRLYGIKNS